MFYLLADNSIIDSKNLIVRVNEYQGNQFLARDSKNRYVLGKIKKQSENVFDLIEKGDLVKVLNTIVKVEKIMKNTVMATALNAPFDVTMIDAIYKPDDKGNYIKVWEKKYEKNEQR